jgi:hypothetical protein
MYQVLPEVNPDSPLGEILLREHLKHGHLYLLNGAIVVARGYVDEAGWCQKVV